MKLKENFLTFSLLCYHEEIDQINRKAEIHEQAILAGARSWDFRRVFSSSQHTLAHSNQNKLL